jgi:hypothetical protein
MFLVLYVQKSGNNVLSDFFHKHFAAKPLHTATASFRIAAVKCSKSHFVCWGFRLWQSGSLRVEGVRGGEQFTWHQYADTLRIQYATCFLRGENHRTLVTTRSMESPVTDFIAYVGSK